MEHQLDYGLNNPIDDDVVELTFTEELGGIAAGEVLRVRAGGNEHSRAYLPVEPRGARVVAVDGHGRPALLRHPVGAGEVVLSTYPLEHMASCLDRVNPEPTHRLYAALAQLAGIRAPVVVDDPEVFTDTLVHDDGRRFAWLVSQSAQEKTVTPVVRDGRLLALGTDEPVDKVTLGPHGVTCAAAGPGG